MKKKSSSLCYTFIVTILFLHLPNEGMNKTTNSTTTEISHTSNLKNLLLTAGVSGIIASFLHQQEIAALKETTRNLNNNQEIKYKNLLISFPNKKDFLDSLAFINKPSNQQETERISLHLCLYNLLKYNDKFAHHPELVEIDGSLRRACNSLETELYTTAISYPLTFRQIKSIYLPLYFSLSFKLFLTRKNNPLPELRDYLFAQNILKEAYAPRQ